MSNRLTFSLASLIFLIAFGLVFGTTTVLADDGHDGFTAGAAHPHKTAPTVSIKLYDVMVGGASTARNDSVQLVNDVTSDTATLRATNDGGQFAVIVTFSEAVFTDREKNTGSFAIEAVQAAGRDVLITATPRKGNNTHPAGDNLVTQTSTAGTIDFTSESPIRLDATSTPTLATVIGTDGKEVAGQAYLIIFTVSDTAADLVDDRDDDTSTDDDSIDVWVTMKADAMYNQTGLVDGTTNYATGSTASSRYKFTIVKTLMKPTVTITTPSSATVGAAFTATLTFSEALSSTLAASDIVVTNGVAGTPTKGTPNDGTVWTVEITPIVGVTSVTVGVADTVATGTAQTVDKMPDTTAPTVVIAKGTQSGRSLPVTITVADETALAAGAAIEASEVTVTGGTLGPLSSSADVYSGTITIDYDTTSVTVAVAADAVSDTSNNMSAAASETFTGLTSTPAPPGKDTLAAGGYRVLVGSGFDATTLPGVSTTEVAGFPNDLAEYLVAGGTINVEATGGDVIINEMMVARDTYKIGSSTHDPADGQWIELYNKHATEAATGIKVTFNQEVPAVSPASYADRFSNVAGQGWAFLTKFTDAAVLNGSSNPQARVDFKSIRRTDAGKDGSDAGAWGVAEDSLLFATGRIGTPGGQNIVDVFKPAVDRKPARSSVLISEVANRVNDETEWIELKGPANQSLKNWQLSIATEVGKETLIFNFPGNDNIRISPNGYLLLTDVDPLNSELEADWANGVHTPSRYKNAVVNLGALPDDGNFILILRNRKDRMNHATLHYEGIEDIAGYDSDLSHLNPYTTLWPLTGNVGTINAKNKLVGGKVYRRLRTNIDGYSQEGGDGNKPAFGAVGFTGLGYDRNAPVIAENGGTPGYPHGNFKGDGADAPGNVFISEIMYATGNGGPTRNRNLPQWIELHNQSDVHSVNLTNWRLEIVNAERNADGSNYDGKFSENVELSGTIPPNQTYLIVEHVAGSNTRLPRERVKIVGKKFNENLLNPYGFHLTLKAKRHKAAHEQITVDTAGNLNEATDKRRPDSRSFAGNAWELEKAIAEDNSRISISRRYNAWSEPNVTATGEDKAGWILTDMDQRYSGLIQLTYYGRTDDLATPGYTIGGALPVQLSTFRPQRHDDGTIVIRWTTESELDNAGFNILRSETREGQFTKLNTQLIAGQGTTSERTAYEWKDTTAKPNVVYYYQIQDVSLDGDVATIRTARLRGHVSPAGKATTTWGELKALQ